MIGKIRHEWLRLISVGCVLLFAVLPLATLAFQIGSSDWEYILQDGSFGEAVGNSLLYAFVSAVITTVLALVASYLLNTAAIRRKNILVVLLQRLPGPAVQLENRSPWDPGADPRLRHDLLPRHVPDSV